MIQNFNILDRIRIEKGKEECKNQFNEKCMNNKAEALRLINDSALTFTTFFTLIPVIDKFMIYSFLNARNIIALKIIDHLLSPARTRGNYINLSIKNPEIYNTLKWFIESEKQEDIDDDKILQIIDIAVSILFDTYSDKTIINDIVDIIFKRNRKGLFFDDLIWALYRLNEPYAIEYIAEKLKSTEQDDVALAKNLLNLNDDDESKEAYQSFKEWLKENDSFLYFTGDYFQFKSNPALHALDYERKYLNIKSDSYVFSPLTAHNEEEESCLEAFRALSKEDKELLSDYSYKLYNKNSREWQNWINHPVAFQLKAAKNNSGGVL